ncbi:MAG TPA: BTAD domain-containing putative transcriptional regulator [Iamia sp.]|nr:BTAD domain-containing putative transcriptional regulator [Iamia sp.]
MSTAGDEVVLEVSVLGPLRARRDGIEVALGGRRQKAVLARLALAAGATVPVDRLVDDLWDGDPPRTAVGTVQSYVSNLRRALARAGETVIERVGDGYRLAVPPATLAAARFEDLVARAAAPAGGHATRAEVDAALALLDEALALWHGPALADLADEPWAQPSAVRLEELRLAAMEARFDLHLDAGRHAVVTGDLEAAATAHPLRERFAAQLVVALYRSGRQADALRAYERTRAHLADELGLDPGPALARLATQVLDQDPALDHVPLPPTPELGGIRDTPVSPIPPSSPGVALAVPAAGVARRGLVGRADEIGTLLAAWEQVEAGDRRLAVVAGEAGMGKTRLAQELAARVHARGGHVFWGRCTADALLSYQPVVEALRTAARELGDDATRALLAGHPGVAPLLPDLVDGRPDTTRYEMYEALAALVDDVTAGRPALFVVDDAQWADTSTLSLLRHLLEHPRAGRLLVLATTRRPAGRPTPDLDRLVADQGRAGIGSVLELEGLAADEVATLLGDRGVTLDAEAARAIHDRTAGNPFFVESLADQGGDLGAADVRALPDTVRDVLDQRLAALPAEATAVLTAAAVVGPRVPLDLLGDVTGQDADAVLDAVDAAVAARLLVEDDELGWVGFPHALVRQALLARTTRNREAQLHLRVADALRGSGAVTEEAGHLLAAGRMADPERTAEAAGRAAWDALAALADDEAATWADRGLAVLPPTAHAARAELGLVKARAERRRGRREAAQVALAVMADEARAGALPLLLAEAAQEAALVLGGVGFSFGEVDEALLALLDEALAAQPEDATAVRAGLLAWSALARSGGDDLEAVDALSARALALAEAEDDRHLLALARFARRMALMGPAGLAERLAIGPATTEAAAGWADLEVVSLVLDVADLMEAGRLDEARRVRERLRAVVAPHRRPVFDAYLLFVDACWALVEGDVDRAAALSDRGLEVGAEALGANGFQAWAGQQYIVARERGDITPLTPQVEAIVEQLPGLAVWRVALAVCRVVEGDDDAARAAYAPVVADGTLAIPTVSAMWYTTVAQLAEVARLVGDTATSALLVETIAPVADHVTVTGMGAVSLGHCTRYLGLAQAGAGDLDAAEATLARAAEQAGAAGFGPWRARALVDRADVLDERGGPGDAEAAAALRAEAEDLAGDLGIALGLRLPRS